jgi:phage terminase large subunit
MLAVLWFAVDPNGRLWVYRELCHPGLTLSQAADSIQALCKGEKIHYIVASPDLWNRRQDSGQSGVMIMSRTEGLPPLVKADDRRIIGWRNLREYFSIQEDGQPKLRIFSTCQELIRCLPALCHDRLRPEDVAGQPHNITHAPEALRYGVMSCPPISSQEEEAFIPYKHFTGKAPRKTIYDF